MAGTGVEWFRQERAEAPELPVAVVLCQGPFALPESFQVNESDGAVWADEEMLRFAVGFPVGFPVEAAVLEACEGLFGFGDGSVGLIFVFGIGGEAVDGDAVDGEHDHDAGMW